MKTVFIVILLASNLAWAGLNEFSLISVDTGKSQSLQEITGNKKFLVLISQGNGCPIFRRYIPYYNKLQKTFEGKAVAIIMLNSFLKATGDSIKKEIGDFKIDVPVFIDHEQKIAREFDISTLSEVALIEVASMKLLYKGAMDDRIRYDFIKEKPQKNYLIDAIESSLAGKTVTVTRTKAFGCAIAFGH